MDIGWLRRRWMEFRWGHGTYLSFLLNAVNFVLIVYRLLIEHIKPLKAFFSHLYIFVVVFVIVYPPIAILIGRWHRKRQLAIDASLVVEHSPYAMENFERLKRVEAMLEKIIKKD